MVAAKDFLKWKEFVAEMLGMKTFEAWVMRQSNSAKYQFQYFYKCTSVPVKVTVSKTFSSEKSL